MSHKDIRIVTPRGAVFNTKGSIAKLEWNPDLWMSGKVLTMKPRYMSITKY